MQARLDELKLKLVEFWETIQESESYRQLRQKYDELDTRAQITLQLSVVGAFAFLILLSVFTGIAKVSSLGNELNEREALIGYLQQSADEIKQLKMQAQNDSQSLDSGGALDTLAESLLVAANIDPTRVEISKERDGVEDKKTKEILVDVKLNQVNIRQIVKLLFHFTEQGKKRSVNIKDLNINTNSDPAGYMDANITISAYKAKTT